LDSLELTKILDLSDYTTLCDVGTGGGFPLLALSRYNQKNNYGIKLYGIDARRKKIDAINSMIQKL
jgi:16S rRNA G527 N7-methylase RsmG